MTFDDDREPPRPPDEPDDVREGAGEPVGPPPDPRELFDAMSDDEYRCLFRKLAGHAAWLAGWRGWKTRSRMPEAKTVEDVVSEAISDVISARPGNRWDPRKGRRTLESFLCLIILRKLLNLGKRKEEELRERETDPDARSRIESAANDRPSPERECEIRESRRWLLLHLDAMQESLADRDGEQEVFALLRTGLKPREIADGLGVPSKEIFRRSRNMRSFLRKEFGRIADDLLGDFDRNGDEPELPPDDEPPPPSRPEE